MIHKQLIRTQASFLFRIGVLGGVFASFLAAQVENSPSILHSKEFISNPSLLAHARETVLVDNDPNPFEQPVIRYELDEGAHDFCLSGTQIDLTGMTLKEMFGDKVFTLPSYERCSRVELPGGIYELHFVHSGKHRPGPNRSIRVQVDPPSPPLADSNGYPIDGYWAIEMDPAIDPSHRPGRLRAQPPFQHLLNDGNLYGPVIGDFSSSVMDEYSLFHLLGGGVTYYEPAILQAKDTHWSLVSKGLIFDTDYVIIGNGCDYTDCTYSYAQTHVKDLGNNKFQLFYYGSNFSQSPFFFTNSTGFSNSELTVADPNRPPATFHVVFRFFPDGTQISDLHQGEGALFQSCSYEGKAAVFAYGPADLTAVNSPATTIDNSAKAIRLGNNTAILWRTASSQLTAIAADTACLPAGSAAPGGKDFEVLPLDTLLSDSSSAAALDKKCINCKLSGVDLANLDLDGWDFSGADLSGATLTHVNLRNTKLNGAVFTGTKFSCIDVSGADQNHPADLTSIDFTKFQWVPIDGCTSNFSYTLLSIAKLPPSMWKYLNLSYATFVDAQGQQLSSEAHPLDLSGTILTGVSLQGAILDYATGLAGADLTQAVLSGASLRHVDLSNAVLDGAQLNNANFDNANLSAAHFIRTLPHGAAANLQGAFLRNANLSKGKLSGANFTNASFYSSIATALCIPDPNTGFTNGCATASQATIDLTNFNGAYLFGVDFTGATAQGVDFGNSFLTGANFAGATLSADPSGSGRDTGFSGAFLQGTNLNEVILQNGISLENAFVDFGAVGNVISLELGGQHTIFPGYWNTPGQRVCAQMVYTQPTTVPQTDRNVTCPDGFRYLTGCGAATPDASNPHWKSPVDIRPFASYQLNSTYTPASSQPICQYDPKWIPFDSSLPGGNPASHHRPKRGKRP
jgi:uncharacterized protein YjbI with pentapeptide repeats